MDNGSLKLDIRELLVSSSGTFLHEEREIKLDDEDDIIFNNPLDVILEVVNADGQILIDIIIRGSVNLYCSRCLKIFKYPIEIKQKISFGDNGEEYNLPKSGIIDFAPIVRELIIVELPIKRLCKQSCQGFIKRK